MTLPPLRLSARLSAVRLSAVASVLLLSVACGDKAAEGTNPGECTDRADNDGNGQFDCDDPGCAGSPDCQEGTDGSDGSDGSDGTTTDGNNDGTDGGGDPGGDPGGEGEGGDPGGDPGGEGEGGDPGGDPGGGTGGGPGGGSGGGTGGGGYDGVYVGDVTINATDGTDSDSCTAAWSSGTTNCGSPVEGGCVEIVSSSIMDAFGGCEMTGSFSSVGTVVVTFGGSVNSTGQVTGTLDGYSTPVMGNINTNTLRVSFNWTKDGIDYNGSFDVSK